MCVAPVYKLVATTAFTAVAPRVCMLLLSVVYTNKHRHLQIVSLLQRIVSVSSLAAVLHTSLISNPTLRCLHVTQLAHVCCEVEQQQCRPD
jgi:hypothetical protein